MESASAPPEMGWMSATSSPGPISVAASRQYSWLMATASVGQVRLERGVRALEVAMQLGDGDAVPGDVLVEVAAHEFAELREEPDAYLHVGSPFASSCAGRGGSALASIRSAAPRTRLGRGCGNGEAR